MINIELSSRQKEIIEIVKLNQPITAEHLAEKIQLTRSALRTDLALLIMMGILEAKPKVGYYYAQHNQSDIISDKIKSITVSQMKSVPVVIDEQVSVYDAVVVLFLEDTGSIFVLSNGYLAGVVSRKDLLKSIMGGQNINKVPIGMIMTRMPNIIMINDHDKVIEAAKRIIEHEVDGLPVVEEVVENNKKLYKVIGKITKTNIARLMLDLATKSI